MSQLQGNKIFLLLTVTPIVIFTDQLSKHLHAEVCNSGFAFGLGEANLLFLILVLAFIGITLVRNRLASFNFPYVLIFAGGLSNLIDRLIFGCVRDFITIGTFPSFNVADLVITIGVLQFLFISFKKWTKAE